MSKTWEAMDNEEKIRSILAEFGTKVFGGVEMIDADDETVCETAKQILELFT